MQILNITRKTVIAEKARVANTMASRMNGLLNRSSLEPGEALLITSCQSIHMFFMKFAIDAIFADKQNVVVGLVKNIKPWSLSPIFFKANYVLELPSGKIESSNTNIGDYLSLVNPQE